MIGCTCDKWKANQSKLVARDMFLQFHGMPYKGDVYTHCPWCGSKLEDDGPAESTPSDGQTIQPPDPPETPDGFKYSIPD